MSKELRCYICNVIAPVGEPGWDRQDAKRTVNGIYVEPRDLCPKHRQSRPKALTTLGELIAAKAAR